MRFLLLFFQNKAVFWLKVAIFLLAAIFAGSGLLPPASKNL